MSADHQFRAPVAAPEHPDTTTVLVLGLVSLAVGVTGPFAWYLGARAERQIAVSGQMKK